MRDSTSIEFEQESAAGEIDLLLSPSIEEEFAFLPIGEGNIAVVHGPAPAKLLENLQARYRRIFSYSNGVSVSSSGTSVDNPFRSERAGLDDDEDLVDLTLLLWPSIFMDYQHDWLPKLSERLAPGSIIIIIESADRPPLPEQKLVLEMMALWADYRNSDCMQPVRIPQDYDTVGALSEAGYTHIRTKVFTDPDLLISASDWLSILDQITTEFLSGGCDTPGGNKVADRLKALQEKVVVLQPATPPIRMITARNSRFQSDHRGSVHQKEGHSEPLPYLPPIEIRENPIERLRFFGADYLRSSELLSLLLQSDNSISSDENPESIAAKILSEYGTRALTYERNPGRMAELLGVTIEIASRVVAILELGRRFFEETTTRTPFIRSPEDAHKYLKDMALLKKEHLRGLYLNVQSRLIHDEVISIGTLSRSIVHPREVFAPALEHAAFAIILAHNHPSGDLTPSAQDLAVTRNIAEAGRTLGIELLDHIIIGTDDFLSMKKEKQF